MQGLEAKRYSSTFNCFASVLKEEGVLSLWKGTTPRLSRVACSGAITFATFEQVMIALNKFSPDK
jgi:solute carrier family 25 citrate transporter 1